VDATTTNTISRRAERRKRGERGEEKKTQSDLVPTIDPRRPKKGGQKNGR